MNNHLKANLTFILLLLHLFITGCSSTRGGAASGEAILIVEKKSEDNYAGSINSKHSTDLQSPTIQEIEVLDPIVRRENLGSDISTSKKNNELKEIIIPIKMLQRDQIDKSLSIDDYQNAVVTIVTKAGHGSGFIITEDGYVLTNQHVVGGERFVNINLVAGREVKGEVIRTDRIGNVALIKLEEDLYPYVLLGNSSLLNIDDEVYAIGAPLEEEFSHTVTKGIVSSFRMEKGLRFIQSDVTVHGGNKGGPLVSLQNGVVGICVSGHSFLDSNIAAGLNEFIPIEDAITMLNINNEEITIQNIEEII
jgi:S1-C subfamily serine protease